MGTDGEEVGLAGALEFGHFEGGDEPRFGISVSPSFAGNFVGNFVEVFANLKADSPLKK